MTQHNYIKIRVTLRIYRWVQMVKIDYKCQGKHFFFSAIYSNIYVDLGSRGRQKKEIAPSREKTIL